MVKGGCRRKIGSHAYVLSNAEILRRCNTEDIPQFIVKQQRKFVANVIKADNKRTTERLLFNDDSSKKRERNMNLYKTVIKNEKVTPDAFNQNALLGLY